MGIFLRQSYNVPPRLWGSPQDRQYSIWRNLEDIYRVDHKSEVLIMPGFWGLPPRDYSGYNNHGTNHGATYKDGSLDFDGDNDYVEIQSSGSADLVGGVGGATVSAWVYINEDAKRKFVFHDTWATAITRIRMEVQATENLIIGARDTEGATQQLKTTNSALSIGTWLNVVGVYDIANDNLIIYVDGNIPAQTGTINFTQTSFAADDTTTTTIGVQPATFDHNFNGLIDEVRISNVARTAETVALFNDNKYGLYQKVGRPIWSIPSGITLTIAAIDGAGLLDNVVLTQKHNLAIQGMSGAGSIDSTILTQKHLLTLQELLSSGVLDNVALIQKHLLSVQELSGAGALDNIDLTQKHTLAVQSLLSAGTLDAIELILATLLVVSDLLSAGALDNTELTQKHILTVQEVLSAGVLDGVALTQKQLLIINNLLSNGLIDTINFDIVSGLIYISLSQATEYNISLSQATEYNISLSQATEYNISLSETGGGV